MSYTESLARASNIALNRRVIRSCIGIHTAVPVQALRHNTRRPYGIKVHETRGSTGRKEVVFIEIERSENFHRVI